MYDFIIGNEFETFAEKRQTIELMLEIPKPYLPDIFHIIPFPKADIIKWYEKNSIKPKLGRVGKPHQRALTAILPPELRQKKLDVA